MPTQNVPTIVNQYNSEINNALAIQQGLVTNIQLQNDELSQKQQIQLQQLQEIQDKEKLLLTRSRMLQISQDRNSYKKKIIYTLIAIIFIIFILILVFYVMFSKKRNSQ